MEPSAVVNIILNPPNGCLSLITRKIHQLLLGICCLLSSRINHYKPLLKIKQADAILIMALPALDLLTQNQLNNLLLSYSAHSAMLGYLGMNAIIIEHLGAPVPLNLVLRI